MTNRNLWLETSALCELLAFGLRLPTPELAEAITSGEFAEAAFEIGSALKLEDATLSQAQAAFASYGGKQASELFRPLRIEYTRLFVGSPKPQVSPYAGVWWALDHDVEPLLFVNERARKIEDLLHGYGVRRAEDINEPFDHVATMLEFLQYAASLNARAVSPPDGVAIPESAYHDFVEQFFADWIPRFARATLEATEQPFYRGVATLLAVFPAERQ